MEFNPPMEFRSDKNLFNIISNDEKWSSEAQKAAYEQLLKRSYSEIEIQRKKENRRDIIARYKQREEQQRAINKSESYSILEMIFFVLTFPVKIIFLSNILRSYYDLDKNNYKKKIIQRICLNVISIAFWFLVLMLII